MQQIKCHYTSQRDSHLLIHPAVNFIPQLRKVLLAKFPSYFLLDDFFGPGFDFEDDDFLGPGFDLDAEDFFGTLAPSFLASERPMAIACFLLVTFFPLLPLFSVPSFFSCIALSTLSPAFLEYFAIE